MILGHALILVNIYMYIPIYSAAAIVSLERTFYQASEDVGTVEVCASVLSPVIDCPIEFPFDVRLTITNDSAGKKVANINILL